MIKVNPQVRKTPNSSHLAALFAGMVSKQCESQERHGAVQNSRFSGLHCSRVLLIVDSGVYVSDRNVDTYNVLYIFFVTK